MDDLERLVARSGLTTDEMAELISEARAEARAEVKAEMRAAFARRIRAQAGGEEARGHDEPPAAASDATPTRDATPAAGGEGDVAYVYCVADAGSELSGGTGIAGAQVEQVTAGDLTAVVSYVPRAEFAEDALRRNLNDLHWLEAAATAHQDVIDEASATSTIVPLRLCTIYNDADRVRTMLTEQRDRFAEALDVLRGKSEWGVKVYADLAALETAARTRLGADQIAGSEGGAYFARKRVERNARDEARRIARECVEDAHTRFSEWAADAVVNRPQSRELAGYEGEMLLNASYLMDDDRAPEFAKLVRELEERCRRDGLRFELTGPWPPYNFVPGRAEAVQ